MDTRGLFSLDVSFRPVREDLGFAAKFSKWSWIFTGPRVKKPHPEVKRLPSRSLYR